MIPGYDATGGTTPGSATPTLSAVNALAGINLAGTLKVPAEVLFGRDRPPAWRSPRRRRLATALAWAGFALMAVALMAGAISTARERRPPVGPGFVHGGPGIFGWLSVGLAVSAALPLAPRFALLAWRIAFLGVLVTPLIPGQTRADAGYYVVLAVALAVAGTRYGPRHTWWMWGLSLIPVWLWTGPDWVYPAVNTGWLGLLAIAAHAVSYWRRDRQALTALAERQRKQAERQRERNAVLEERTRIAREMHDVVAHHMSMIAVQAETAPYRVPDLPSPAQKEFASLSEAAREALTEMRRLLGVLRSETTVADNSKKTEAGRIPELAPQPRLGDVPELVRTARRAGARVDLDMPESGRLLPSSVGLAAYRIVQESLSNAARHAPGAKISVVIEEDPSFVSVTVTNEPPDDPPPPADGTGQGLTGMRERVALLGGDLSAGPESGGFAVRALLPTGDTRER